MAFDLYQQIRDLGARDADEHLREFDDQIAAEFEQDRREDRALDHAPTTAPQVAVMLTESQLRRLHAGHELIRKLGRPDPDDALIDERIRVGLYRVPAFNVKRTGGGCDAPVRDQEEAS